MQKDNTKYVLTKICKVDIRHNQSLLERKAERKKRKKEKLWEIEKEKERKTVFPNLHLI